MFDWENAKRISPNDRKLRNSETVIEGSSWRIELVDSDYILRRGLVDDCRMHSKRARILYARRRCQQN